MFTAAVNLKTVLAAPYFLIAVKHHVYCIRSKHGFHVNCRSTSQGYTVILIPLPIPGSDEFSLLPGIGNGMKITDN